MLLFSNALRWKGARCLLTTIELCMRLYSTLCLCLWIQCLLGAKCGFMFSSYLFTCTAVKFSVFPIKKTANLTWNVAIIHKWLTRDHLFIKQIGWSIWLCFLFRNFMRQLICVEFLRKKKYITFMTIYILLDKLNFLFHNTFF